MALIKTSLLTIAIPTYNRALVLKEALDDIIPKIEDLPINVLVINNASTDDTDTIAQSYGSKIRYIKNNQNIGGDLNILKCYTESVDSSEYTCVLGDSYRLSKAYLLKLVSILKTRKYNVVINARGQLSRDKEYDNADSVLRELGGGMDLTSTIVISNEGVKKDYYSKYVDTNFIHFGMCFEYLASLSNINAYAISCYNIGFTALHRNNTWYKHSVEIFTKVWYITISRLPHAYSEISRYECMIKHDRLTRIFSRRNILHLILEGAIDQNLFHENNEYIIKTVVNYPFLNFCVHLPKYVIFLIFQVLNMLVFIKRNVKLIMN